MRASTLSTASMILTSLFVGGCAHVANVAHVKPAAPTVDTAMVDLGGGASEATLEHGREIFTTRCATCHAAYPVSSHSTIEWHRIADEMADRTKLTPEEKSAMLDYIAAANAARLASR